MQNRSGMSVKNFIMLAQALKSLSSSFASKKSVSQTSYNSDRKIESHVSDLNYLGQQEFVKPRVNKIVNICAQNENIIIERLGKFLRVQGPGLFFSIPYLDKLKYCIDCRELTVPVSPQHSITQDNVSIHLGGVVYFQITDPHKCAYGVSNPIYAVLQYAQSAMRAIVGKNSLDEIFHNREEMNKYILHTLKGIVETWGITVLRYEITDVDVAQEIKDAMSRQASAERKRREDVLHAEALKRSQILESEGFKEKLINESLGNKIRVENEAIAFSEAVKIKATAERERLILEAEGKAKALDIISQALNSDNGKNAASLELARNYIEQFGRIAENSNSIVIPEDLNNVAGFITKALAVAQFNLKSGDFPQVNKEEEKDLADKKKH